MKKLLLLLCGFGISISAMLTEEEKQQKEALIKWMRGAPIQEIQNIKKVYANLFRLDEPISITCSNDSEVPEYSEKNETN